MSSKQLPLFGDADVVAVHVPSSKTPEADDDDDGGAAEAPGAAAAASDAVELSLAESRAGRGRKRKPSALAQEALEAARPAAASGGSKAKRGKGMLDPFAAASADALASALSPLSPSDGLVSPCMPAAAGASPPPSGGTAGNAAGTAASAAAAAAAAAARALPVPHVLVSYTDVTSQSTTLYCIPTGALTNDESDLLASLHGAGATRNDVAQVVLERVLKKHSARMCVGGPLTHGREFVMQTADQVLAAGAANTAAAAAAAAVLPATPATPASASYGQYPNEIPNGLSSGSGGGTLSAASAEKLLRRHRAGKGFHNFWVDRLVVGMYVIAMIAASPSPALAAAASAAGGSGGAASSPVSASAAQLDAVLDGLNEAAAKATEPQPQPVGGPAAAAAAGDAAAIVPQPEDTAMQPVSA